MSFFEEGTLKSNETIFQEILGVSGKSDVLGRKSGVRVSKLSGSTVQNRLLTLGKSEFSLFSCRH